MRELLEIFHFARHNCVCRIQKAFGAVAAGS